MFDERHLQGIAGTGAQLNGLSGSPAADAWNDFCGAQTQRSSPASCGRASLCARQFGVVQGARQPRRPAASSRLMLMSGATALEETSRSASRLRLKTKMARFATFLLHGRRQRVVVAGDGGREDAPQLAVVVQRLLVGLLLGAVGAGLGEPRGGLQQELGFKLSRPDRDLGRPACTSVPRASSSNSPSYAISVLASFRAL